MKTPLEGTIKKRTVSPSPGTADELYETGIMYELGIGAEKDLDQAAKWYAAAAAKGHKDANLALEDVKAEVAEAGRPADYNADSIDQLKKNIERSARQQARGKILLDKSDQARKEAIKRLKSG